MNTLTNTSFATKSDIVTANWTRRPETLILTLVDAENKLWYCVSHDGAGKTSIRKMSITRDPAHARSINKKAKGLIGKKVYFGVTAGWSPEVWFNDLTNAED